MLHNIMWCFGLLLIKWNIVWAKLYDRTFIMAIMQVNSINIGVIFYYDHNN